MTDEYGTARYKDISFNVCFDRENAQQASFWTGFHNNQWEPGSRAFLTGFLKPGDCYIDIGAWIGPLVLLAAAKGARVIAFEPDRSAYGCLEKNVAANPTLRERICLINSAVADVSGSGLLFDPRNSFGASTSSLYSFGEAFDAQAIDRLDADEVFRKVLNPRVKLIKIDTEGGEYKIIPRAAAVLREYSPTIMISLHPFVFRNTNNPLLSAVYNIANIMQCLDHYKYKYILGDDRLHAIRVDELLSTPFGQGTLVFSQEPPGF